MQNYAERKAAVIADDSRFSRVCSAIVTKNVIYCVSSLFSGLSQDLERAAEMFDEDYDDMLGWFSRPDYEEAADQFIREADMEQLEEIVENEGNWSDVLEKVQTTFPGALRKFEITTEEFYDSLERFALDEEDARSKFLDTYPECTITGVGEVLIEADEWIEVQPEVEKEIRAEAMSMTTDYEWVCRNFDLEPDEIDIYEHWIVDRYFASLLEAQGETVFEFCNMTVWGRAATGQNISMDGVVRSLVIALPDTHWVWAE